MEPEIVYSNEEVKNYESDCRPQRETAMSIIKRKLEVLHREGRGLESLLLVLEKEHDALLEEVIWGLLWGCKKG